MAAAFNGDADEIDCLLAMPCDIDAQDSHGMTALMYAAMEGHTMAVQRLIDHQAGLEIQSLPRYTALMYAVRCGHLETVQILIGAKADLDVNGDNDTFETPLTIAAVHGFFPIFRALVVAGADISLHGGFGQRTAECIARHQERHDISEFLCCHKKRPSA